MRSNAERTATCSAGPKLSMLLVCLLGLLAVTRPFDLLGQVAPPPGNGRPTPNQQVAANYVLRLDGHGSFLELPPGSFTNLTEVTVEGWVKWDSFGTMSRFFDFGLADRRLDALNRSTTSTLWLETLGINEVQSVQIPNILSTNQWTHVAAVYGKTGLKIFVNGVLATTSTEHQILATTGISTTNYLGRSSFYGIYPDADFQGEMDEVRVWNRERSTAEIRDNLFKDLTGNEPGLVALWNFEDGTARDSSPNHHDGRLRGNAMVARSARPGAEQVHPPTVLVGKVTDGAGNSLTNATLRILQGDTLLSSAVSRQDGTYSVVLQAETTTCDIEAATGNLGAWVLGVKCRRGERNEINVSLSNAVSIVGKVTAFDGSLIPGVVVQIIRGEAPAVESGRLATPGLVRTVLTTNTNGLESYRLLNLRPGNYKVRLHLPGGQLEYRPGELVQVAPGNTVSADFQVAPFRKGRWRRYSTANGLPSNRVFDLRFVSDGTLWLATQNGISHFDGLKFTNYSKRSGLLNNRVFCIERGTDGTLWFGTEEGLSAFNPATGKFQNFPSGTNDLAAGAVIDMATALDGTLWVLTRDGLSRFDGQSFHRISEVPAFTGPFNADSSQPRSLAVDRDGRLWAGAGGQGLWRFEGTNVTHVTQKDGLLSLYQSSLQVASDGAIWFLEYREDSMVGITRYNGQRFESLGVADVDDVEGIRELEVSPEGGVWFGHSGGGLTRYDPRSRSLVHISEMTGAPSEGGIKLQSGPDGALWFASSGGLYRYDEQTFTSYGKADGLPENDVTFSAALPDGSIWFSGQGTYVAMLRPSSTNLWEKRFINARDEGFESTGVYALEPDTRGGLWLGGDPTTGGIFYHDPGARSDGQRQFRKVSAAKILDSGFNLALHIDSQARLWIGKWNQGLYRVPLKDIWNSNATSVRVEGVTNYIGTIYEDSRGAIWTAARYRSDTISRILGADIQHFSPQTTGGGLPSGEVWCFQEAPDGRIFIGTGAGLASFDGKQFRAIEGTSDRPVPAGRIFSILRDRQDVLWFASETGLYRYDGVAWSSLAEEDGLASTMVETITQAQDGTYWVGTDKGVTRYRPTRQIPVTPHLTVKADREYSSTEIIPAITSGQLVGFRFNAVDFKTQPSRRFYRCAIVPGKSQAPPTKNDPAWREPTLASQFDWNPRTPGNYSFFVQFIDRDLNYSEPAGAFLRIVTPWYANAWIMAPTGTVFSGLVAWAFVARLLYTNKRKEALRLREQMLEQERQARLLLEAKNKELAQAKDAADAASAAKSQFLANMSHELRTPLNAIIGYSEMLQEEVVDLGQTRLQPDLMKIHGAGRHLLGLINDILDLSKIEAGKTTLYLEEFDLPKMVHDVATTVQPLVIKNGNQLEVVCASDIGSMRADLTKVRQTLFNLLSNACKFTEKGTIRLTVQRITSHPLSAVGNDSGMIGEEAPGQLSVTDRHSLISFSVQDTGIGMTPEQMGRLFEAFSQADSSTTRKYGGTGLGLTLSRKFCRMMGGDLTVSSVEGKGSTFTACIPRQVQNPLAEQGTSFFSRTPTKAPFGSTVLVIDDEANARELIARALGKEGFRVELAADGRTGLELARKLKPQAITLDVMMPGMDGWAVLSALKADPATAGIPVIMLTVVDEKQIGFALGAADYFTKPIDWSRMTASLQKYRSTTKHQVVLVVEDDAPTREMLQRTLVKENWEVVEAENGRVALEKLSGLVPALILLDLMMPEMDGFEFMDELRKRPECRQVPVVVITAKDITEQDRKRLNGQVARVMQKASLQMDDLVREVRALSDVSSSVGI
jgi:signal transduction histidine kinase/DNA-binding response OmpR family regulator/ligand-binding sensor domain-containing protein